MPSIMAIIIGRLITAIYDDVVERFGTASEPRLLEVVVAALVNKGFTLGALGRSDEAIAIYDNVIKRNRCGQRSLATRPA